MRVTITEGKKTYEQYVPHQLDYLGSTYLYPRVSHQIINGESLIKDIESVEMLLAGKKGMILYRRQKKSYLRKQIAINSNIRKSKCFYNLRRKFIRLISLLAIPNFFLNRYRATSRLLVLCPVIEAISLVVMFKRRKAASFLSPGERSGNFS